MYQDNRQSQAPKSRYEFYLGLRQQALESSPTKMGVMVSPDSAEPFGIVMDLGIRDGIITVVSFITGDASSFTSAGAGVLRGLNHESVRNLARNFVLTSSNYLGKMMTTTEFPLPKLGRVRFYILTPKGIFTHEAYQIELYKNEFFPLISAGQRVITELFAITQQKKMET